MRSKAISNPARAVGASGRSRRPTMAIQLCFLGRQCRGERGDVRLVALLGPRIVADQLLQLHSMQGSGNLVEHLSEVR